MKPISNARLYKCIRRYDAIEVDYFSKLKERMSENQGVSVVQIQKELGEVDQELKAVTVDIEKVFILQSQLDVEVYRDL